MNTARIEMSSALATFGLVEAELFCLLSVTAADKEIAMTMTKLDQISSHLATAIAADAMLTSPAAAARNADDRARLFAELRQLAAGIEPIAHNGSTRDERIAAAKAAVAILDA